MAYGIPQYAKFAHFFHVNVPLKDPQNEKSNTL
jgi:hypothetical protein